MENIFVVRRESQNIRGSFAVQCTHDITDFWGPAKKSYIASPLYRDEGYLLKRFSEKSMYIFGRPETFETL